MKTLRKPLSLIFIGIFALLITLPALSVVLPAPSVAAADAPAPAKSTNCDGGFLGIPPWYRGLTTGSDCAIINPNEVGGLQNFIWRIVLNAIEIGLVLAAYIAVFFIIYGGFLFMTASGDSTKVENGKKSVMNAVVGLVISMGAIAITKFIFGIVGDAKPGANGIVQLTGEQLLQNGLNIAYFSAGVIAVISIIFGGIMYATSSGDSGKVSKAKNTITYAVIGLVVILLAFVITNFVIGSMNK